MNHRRLLAVMVALAACLPDRAFRPAPAQMDAPAIDAAADRSDIEVAEANDADVVVVDATVGDVADADVADADAAATCADACADGEGCFAGSCRAQRSCPRSDTNAGCGLVEIPGGRTFTMNPDGGPDAGGRELPGITVGGFVMDSHEVTVARFRVFWNRGAPELPDRPIRYPNGTDISTAGWVAEPPMGATEALPVCHWSEEPGAYEQHPINCVSKRMAQAFCVWDAGGGAGGGRIPTSAEWEYAAVGRYGDGRSFPWGTTPPSNDCSDRRAHFLACLGDGGARTVPVGTFLHSGGLFDLAGNVNEWVADERSAYGYLDLCWWSSERSDPLCLIAYPLPPPPPPPGAGPDTAPFTLRGGGYSSPVAGIVSARPGRAEDGVHYQEVGFRCVRARGVSSPDRNDAGTGACSNGQVSCPPTGCVDPLMHSLHCGRCGHTCPAGEGCEQGRCVEVQRSCPPPRNPTLCGVISLPAGAYRVGPADGVSLDTDVRVSAVALDVHEVSVERFRLFWAAVNDPTTPWRPPPGWAIAYPSRSVPWSPPTGGPLGGLRAPATNPAACNWSEEMASPSREAHPINCLDWWTAQAFCYWDSDSTSGRLPTLAEWEYAARGTVRIGLDANRTWPWGGVGDNVCARARVGGCGVDRTGEVGRAVTNSSYGPFGGFYDMTGNVNEWTADVRITIPDGGVFDGGVRYVNLFDCWRRAGGAGALGDPICVERSGESVDAVLIQGGSFNDAAAAPATRGGSDSGRLGGAEIGFRCARSP